MTPAGIVVVQQYGMYGSRSSECYCYCTVCGSPVEFWGDSKYDISNERALDIVVRPYDFQEADDDGTECNLLRVRGCRVSRHTSHAAGACN